MFVWVIKKLWYKKNNISEWIDINVSNKSKECMICQYGYFKDIACKFQSHIYHKCHDISMMAYELETIAILNVKGADYRCVLWNMTRNDITNRLNNFKLDNNGTLGICILVQIKHLLK